MIWDITASRGGVPLLRGTALKPDSRSQGVTTVPVLLEDRLARTSLSWLELAPFPDAAEAPREALRLDHATRWCAVLRRAHLDT